MTTEVAGTKGALFSLVFKTTALTILTLGVYSFWARTRVRRWLWSSLRIGGAPMEYVGQPLEKLMGFVFAAVIVAVYLGLVVMVLIFASLNLFETPEYGFYAAIVLLAPVYWFAQYRGLRYLLNHTRWRGIGFSLGPGAWGYVWRAALWMVLSIVSVGLAWPLRTLILWKYRAARAFYGDDHFRLEAPLAKLYGAAVPLICGLWLSLAVVYAGATRSEDSLWMLPIPLAVMVFGWIYWKVNSFRILASGLGYGGAAGLRLFPKTGTVIGIHLGGWVLVGLILFVALIALLISTGVLVANTILNDLEAQLTDAPVYLLIGLGVLTYLTLFLGRSALRLVFVTFPLIRHVGETLQITGAAEVNAVRQGERHHMHDADGFANLFDLGSGI
ncbi:MAG: DUF898 family protein [Pseudomonadota bacterium]